MTEYLYDRDNPKSHFRQRISGIQGLFYGVPNINERADMIGRYTMIFLHNIELSQKRLMGITSSLSILQESQEIWHRNGEHTKTSPGSSRTHLLTSIGKRSHFMPRTE